MAEGARFPWKIQKVNPAPYLSYKNIHKPLATPKGKRWNFNSVTNEWSLVGIEKKTSPPVVDAVLIESDDEAERIYIDSDKDSPPTPPFSDHYVTPSDTFQGICLRYKITPLKLRQVNGGFTGTNLHLAPNPLKIPNARILDTSVVASEVGRSALTQDQVVRLLVKECHDISKSEARAYLMMNDWDLPEALENAHEDGF
mmetsp:Transcript_6977/g.14214  ORF Transcript_6977/g.14214 Transcript_6977/m.14214 type:complete len:199 (+) Transcript_6977:2037-2633(+)